ncbi:HNH/ENDO VII family nuclease [Devosia alba]|uniref:HNH/ENDO VII family nuclease n=1 Tax=Devosia alba TaxID=3152360 RepID=UPI003262DFB1
MAGGNIGTGALAGGASEIANGVLQQALAANPDLTQDQKTAITQWVATAVGAAVGGQAGAAAALDNINHNYLTHEQLATLAMELAACDAGQEAAACKANASQRYQALDFAQENAFQACRTMECVDQHLGEMQFDQAKLYSQILAIQELGADSALGQRLLANQINERPLTGGGSVLDLRIASVIAGVSYCEESGQAPGCFEQGQTFEYLAESVTAAAYAALGASASIRATEAGVAKAPNGIATQAEVEKNFQQNRQFWSSEPINFNGNKIYQRNNLIDPKLVDVKSGKTNLELMQSGRAPIGPDGYPINLHHMTQTQTGPIAEMTRSFHQGNSSAIHINTNEIPSGINRAQFNSWRRDYWKNRASDF